MSPALNAAAPPRQKNFTAAAAVCGGLIYTDI